VTATGRLPRARGGACRRWALRGLGLAWAATPAVLAAAPAQPSLPPSHVLESGSTADADDTLQRLREDVFARLPPAWRAALPATLVLEWRQDLPAQVSGRAVGDRVRLDHRLRAAWADPRVDADLDPATLAARQLGRATLLHELAHVLDRGPHGGLSTAPRLLDLAGWPRRRLWPGRGRNAMTDRSPDRYELADPHEFVAVNLEHYVLDPDYACRRPALAAWFDARLGAPVGNHASACAPELPLLQAEGGNGEVSWLALDPARVYAIDYLFAEGNEAPMSRWGHAMLRLVVCAPGRPPGPDCRLDLAWHRVLSFRAFVDDVQISSWRGVTGGYPSRLFVLPLEQVIDDYTHVELRGLASVPLRLDRAGINAVLAQAARVHWGYDGRYTFLGNNCAVETWKLLRDADPRIEAQVDWRGIAPDGLLAALERRGLADASALQDRAAAERGGYYFASAQARYAAMFEVVRAALAVPVDSVQAWLDLPPSSRAPWIDRADLRATAALLLLEQAAQRRQELRARDWLKQRLASGDAEATGARGQILALVADAGVLARPAALLDGVPGYGLPQAAERQAVEARLPAHNQRLATGWPALRAQAREALPASQREEWDGIDANLQRIQVRLKALAGQE